MAESTFIAERTLLLDGSPTVEVRIAAPEREDEATYVCRYDIVGLDRRGPGRAVGADAYQALLLALHMVAVFVENSPEARAGRLRPVDRFGNLGFRFPDDAGLRDRRSAADWSALIALDALGDWIESEVMPLARPQTAHEAIARLRARLAGEERREARMLILTALAQTLQWDGRDAEARAAIEEQMQIGGDDPRPWLRLAAWHLHSTGAYDGDPAKLTSALAALDTAVAKARGSGFLLRHCLAQQARIAAALGRFDMVTRSIEELLSLPPLPYIRDARLAEDLLERLPDGAVPADLVTRYRKALDRQRQTPVERAAEEVATAAATSAPPGEHLFDRLRAWAALPDEALREQFSPAAEATVRDAIGELLEVNPFAALDRDSFPAVVRMLVALIGEGSRLLAQAMVEADEHKKLGRAREYGDVLRRFIARSPTRFHRLRASNYLAGNGQTEP